MSIDFDTMIEALEFSRKELNVIAGMEPKERIIQEAHLQCIPNRYFRNKGYRAYPEANYFPFEHNNNEKCDLRLTNDDSNETWFELKIASHHINPDNGEILHNRPDTFEERWRIAVDRLRNVPDGAEKMFVLLCFFDHDPDEQDHDTIQRINAFYSDHRFCKYGPFPFTWRGLLMQIKFWVWKCE